MLALRPPSLFQVLLLYHRHLLAGVLSSVKLTPYPGTRSAQQQSVRTYKWGGGYSHGRSADLRAYTTSPFRNYLPRSPSATSQIFTAKSQTLDSCLFVRILMEQLSFLRKAEDTAFLIVQWSAMCDGIKRPIKPRTETHRFQRGWSQVWPDMQLRNKRTPATLRHPWAT